MAGKQKQDMAIHIASPFDTWPETRVLRTDKGGVKAMEIEGAVLTPGRAKLADFLGSASPFVLSALSLGMVGLADNPPLYMWPVALVWSWTLVKLLKLGWRRLLHKTYVLTFTPEHFIARSGKDEAQVFDRQQQHGFRLEARHEKALKEAEKHQDAETRARMRGEVINKTKYHRDTQHLIFDYCGQPRKIMEIMGQDKADRMLRRVVVVDESMEQILAMGDIVSSGPQGQWDDMAGAIPEEV